MLPSTLATLKKGDIIYDINNNPLVFIQYDIGFPFVIVENTKKEQFEIIITKIKESRTFTGIRD